MPEASHDEEKPANIIMAAAQGAQTGVKLAVAVGAMVLAFVALVALANGLLAGIGGWFGYPDLSFQAVIGAIFRPVMWLMGGPIQAQGHLQLALRILGYGQNPQAAADAPRWRIDSGPRVGVAPGTDPSRLAPLRPLGAAVG